MASLPLGELSRRGVLAAAAGAGAGSAAAAPAAPEFDPAGIERILRRYDGFGGKASGGEGDNACGAWIEAELGRMGYRCARQAFEAPFFEPHFTELRSGRASARVIPQAVVVATPEDGVRGPLYIAAPGAPRPAGGLAIIVLEHRRWSSVVGAVARRVEAEFRRGAAAAILVTTGPSGEALALNAPAERALFDRPVAVLSPRAAAPFLEAALRGEPGVLVIRGQGGRRTAFNVTARLDRGAPRTLVLSTPRSGWFRCAGERGSGLSVWLTLAGWAARSLKNVDVDLVCTSGHEYENLGGERYIHELAPAPQRTALWAHLGANVAARDWHALGATLAPLPSADPQRYLMATPELVERAAVAFAGQPGLERVYPGTPETAAGELINILRAGYAPALGIFGAHRYHHAEGDDLRCIAPPAAAAAAGAFARLISDVLAH
jgi:hypothetical protein